MKVKLLSAGAAVAFMTTVAFAQMAAPPAQEFANMAAASDMFEIESSKVALEKAEAADVKQFAEMMIADHTKASQELAAAVQASGEELTVPAMLDAEHRAKIEKLNAASGKEFDMMYVDEQVAGHKKALDLMTSYAEGGDNEALKAHAQKSAPVIQMHYEHVQQLDQKHSS